MALGFRGHRARDSEACLRKFSRREPLRDGAASGIDEDPRSDSWRFPEHVGEAFNRIFDTLDDDEPDVRDVLFPLAYTEGNGLPEGRLWSTLAARLCGRRAPRLSEREVLERLPWFVVDDLASGYRVFRLFHASLRDHLQQGRRPERIHGRIAVVLEQHLSRGAPGGWKSAADDAYAGNYLSRHLRRAGLWRALGKRVMEPSWIARQAGEPPSKNPHYRSDVEEARAAASVANFSAAEAGLSLPALAPGSLALTME